MHAELPRGTWGPSSPTKDQTHVPGIARWVLNHWTTREDPIHSLYVKWINFVTTWPWLHIRIILRIILLKYRPLSLLAAWKKSYDKPRQCIKSRTFTLPTKVHIVKAIVFLVVMYGYESWTIKKAGHWRNDAFELWCCRRHLRVPWTARRSSQSILTEINPEYSLEGLILKPNSNTLATWCEELTHLKRPWCWERLKAGREGDDIGWDGWMASLTWWTWVFVCSREAWHAAVHGFTKSQTGLSDWSD